MRTVELPDGAKAGKDFAAVDQVLDLHGQEILDVRIEIHDDDQWDPDKEFKVELFDPDTGARLSHLDTQTLVTIIDDDKPGFLAFEGKKTSVKHVRSEAECRVTVARTNGSDGKISCQYRTVQVSTVAARSAVPGRDYEHV